MTFRLPALLIALPAVIASLLVAAPADAATTYASVTSKSIAISGAGNGKAAVKCRATKTCKGTLRFAGSTITKSYSVKAKRTSYVAVSMKTTDPAFPGDGVDKGDYKAQSATLIMTEKSPKKVTHNYGVTTETPVNAQQITGRIFNHGNVGVSDVKVQLWSIARGGVTIQRKSSETLSNGEAFSFNVPLGANNSPSPTYRLRIVGTDQNGDFRSWWWRGGDQNPRGGGKYIREASGVRGGKARNYVADFHFGSIRGRVNGGGAGSAITVAAPPVGYGNSADKREIDIPNCANVFGQDTANGSGDYAVGFLPLVPNGTDERYMVQAKDSTTALDLWNDEFGSCANAMGYTRSRANLIPLSTTASANVQNFTLRYNKNTLYVNAGFSGYSPTKEGDRFVRVREKIPGVGILNAPVVRQGIANSSGVITFGNLPRGKYWVEIGRRTGCTDWYPSRYSNNKAYLNGADRGAERWKSFSTLSSLPGNKNSGFERVAINNGATYAQQGKRPGGYAGWMFRNHCKASGAGSYSVVSYGSNPSTEVLRKVTPKVKRGAVVKGRVTRTGGRTNKEMLVTLSSKGSTNVLRTAITGGGGGFTLTGLASGTYTITVNGDSWRGISRTFLGKHTIKVKAGKTYGAGTLRLRAQKVKKEAS